MEELALEDEGVKAVSESEDELSSASVVMGRYFLL